MKTLTGRNSRIVAVQTACELSVPFNKLILIEIVCEEGELQ